VVTAFEQDQLTNLFHLPLSEVAYVQLQSLSFDKNSLSAYLKTMIFGGILQTQTYSLRPKSTENSWEPFKFRVYKWMWESFRQPKHKVLFLASFEGQAKCKKYLEKEKICTSPLHK
jgi:hypothetical protein